MSEMSITNVSNNGVNEDEVYNESLLCKSPKQVSCG